MNLVIRETGVTRRTVYDRNGKNPVHIYTGRPIRRNAPGGQVLALFDAKGHIYALVKMPRTGRRYRHANSLRNLLRKSV